MTVIAPSSNGGPAAPDGPAQPAFLITIDTEGDNLWSAPREITTRNAAFLPRFQRLCERFRLRPTYVTDWEMARCPVFREFARDVLARGTAEIGMHLHAWNSPPIVPLTDDDFRHMPFLVEYPDVVMREKLRVLTAELEDAFGVKMLSHRAGRWAFDARYARMLAELGYRADCSVTPHVSWADQRGDPRGAGGTDYTGFPERPYFLDLTDIARPGASPLLEAPMSVVKRTWPAPVERLRSATAGLRLARRAVRRCFPTHAWLRPTGGNLAEMRHVLDAARRDARPHVEFMLHSSEFMPGGSPTFPTPERIEALYRDLEALFAEASRDFAGLTLAEFAERFAAARPPVETAPA